MDINIRRDAAENLERFLGKNADKSELKEACIHYQPRNNEHNRLEIIICTPEQQKLAWKYGHSNLILLDGTFGVSKHKLLLFIMMVIDENNKGIPIAFILFTPPPNNRMTSADYDSKTLERLLTHFRDKISAIHNQKELLKNPNATPVAFSPLVAMTDTDVKERGPLSKVWPEIILLLCYFHLNQCWKNEMNKRLGRGGDDNAILQRQTLRMYLRNVLKEAWSMGGDEEVVRKFIMERTRSLEDLIKNAKGYSEGVQSVLSSGVEFLTYLGKQWAGDLLYSLSLNGRRKAANILGIPFEKLPMTNNHLEGMNEYLKNNQLKRSQRKGRPLRADVLYVALVLEIIPNVMALRSLAANLEKEKAGRRKEFNITDPQNRELLEREFPHIAYIAESPNRDESARRLLRMRKVIKYEVEAATGKLLVYVESESTPQLVYITCVHGQAMDVNCQCSDFLQNGILCKHLRAAALYIDELRTEPQNIHLPEMSFPTRQEANNIRRILCPSKLVEAVNSEDNVESNSNVSDSDNEDDIDREDEDINTETTSTDGLDRLDIDNTMAGSSDEILGCMGSILGIRSMNVAAISKQKAQPFPVNLL